MSSRPVVAGLIGGAAGCAVVLLGLATLRWSSTLSWLGGPLGLASWVQAVGSVAAVVGALWIALNANAVQRRRDAEARTAVVTSAFMMIHNVRNIATKSRESLQEEATTAFWKFEGGGFIDDLYDQMNRLPIHECADIVVMCAFENARSILTVMSKMHRTIASAQDTPEGYDAYVRKTMGAMEVMAARCELLERAVAAKLPAVPTADATLFSAEELDPIFGPKP